MQHALYRAARADPGRRFHALGDKVHRRDVLRRVWATVRRNDGAPGIDGITLAEIEQYGVDRLLGELATELKEGRWRSLPARRVYIPKPGTAEQRPLSMKSVTGAEFDANPHGVRRLRGEPKLLEPFPVSARRWL